MKYVITTTPGNSNQEDVTIEAVNQLEALDKFAMSEGFGPYSTTLPLLGDGSMGVDEHGLWAIFTNTTIWALPREKEKE